MQRLRVDAARNRSLRPLVLRPVARRVAPPRRAETTLAGPRFLRDGFIPDAYRGTPTSALPRSLKGDRSDTVREGVLSAGGTETVRRASL